LEQFASAIELSAFGQAMRSSAWAYPVANILHLFALAMLAGGIMAVDLRIMGFAKRLSLMAISEVLTPYAVVGLGLFIASGLAMFAADAVALLSNPVFLIKGGAVGAAVANALAFRACSKGKLDRWEHRAPGWARLSALGSLLLWSGAIIFGRLIAYQ
jgi:hypothetical protein